MVSDNLYIIPTIMAALRKAKPTNKVNNKQISRGVQFMKSMIGDSWLRKSDVRWTIKNYENKLKDYENMKWLNDNRWQRMDVYEKNSGYIKSQIRNTKNALKSMRKTASKRWIK